MWIADDEKYALVSLKVQLEGNPPPQQIAPNLWILTDTSFEVPSEWREWLGSIRTKQIADSNVFLVSKLASTTPDILDNENQLLLQRVKHFYVGLLLSAMFSPSHKPTILTGARKNGVIGVRHQENLELPMRQLFRRPPISVDNIWSGAALGQQLEAMKSETIPGGLWRFFRTLDIYVKARATQSILDQIHQYCRCIDGMILPTEGKTKKQFKSRSELFIGPGHHDLMGTLYDIRSQVEHLHENLHLEKFDRSVRLELVRKEAIIEYIVRTALARIIRQVCLWRYFGNTVALKEFWALSPTIRRRSWGDPIDPRVAVVDFDSNSVNDERLEKTSA